MASPESILHIEELFTTKAELHLPRINESFLMTGVDNAWFVRTGSLEVFIVQIEGDVAVGARTHFMTLQQGALFFGMDFGLYGQGFGFLVTVSDGTQFSRLTKEHLRQAAEERRVTAALAEMIDDWLTNLSGSLVRSVRPRPKPDEILIAGKEVKLARGKIATARKGIVWINVLQGEALFTGIEGVSKNEPIERFLPLSGETWIEASNETVIRTSSSLSLISHPGFWTSLDDFHELVCQCEFINNQLRLVDEFNRLRLREAFVQKSKEIALKEIAGVLEHNRSRDSGIDLSDALSEPLLAACQLVAEASGIQIVAPPNLSKSKEKILTIAKASRCRVRSVALRDNWWELDHGPILGYREQTLDPLAIIPTSSKSYELVDPRTLERTPVDALVAATLRPFAISFYAPLPARKLSAWDLIKFGARNCGKDLWMILATGVLVGLLGMVAPYFSGQIFDSIIPSADREQLFQFAIGLVAVALGTFAFELVRAISVLRVEGRMDYAVQAGIMDRLLDLPSTFFRQYTAGDLADRALGVDQIRQAISQAGTQAVVGSISSGIMVLFLFSFNQKMALVAIGLLALAVIVPAAFNFVQLRFQRELFFLRGSISGLVIQLINGVNKLRVSGAEDRAFRVWAGRFAKQKHIAYKAGKITNVIQVFNQVFPILSAGVLFGFYSYFQEQARANGEVFKMTTGEFVAFNTTFMNILSAMMQLSGASLELMIIFPLAERLKPIIETSPEVDEAKANPGELAGAIEIYHLTFRYSQDGPAILKDVSLSIRPGEYAALVGGSGSGKSTLLRLLLGFEKAESGGIFYDGQDINSIDIRELRQQVGVVLQTSKLMPTDIYRNITGSHNLTIEDAWEAARMAGLDRDIKTMPMGMHTVVGEGGGTFSGGQRQRLMIARALVTKPRIIFFDEATSALDNETQRVVTESLDGIRATRIVIAHRLSTIINADRIFVLHNGELTQSGTYTELMNQSGLFAELAQRQLA